MKFFLIFATVFIGTLGFSFNGKANGVLRPRAVYGDDDRREPFAVGNFEYEISRSVAGRFSPEHLTAAGGNFVVTRKTLGAEKCSKNRFAEQTLGPTCSGFLVRPDIIVTAGHCMDVPEKCSKNVWVFDYELKSQGDNSYRTVFAKNIYQCKNILAKSYQDFGNVDYAIIQLDRPVTDRRFLEMDFAHSFALQTPLFVAGYPSGLPLKITAGGKILDNSKGTAFDSDLDIFQGNSGSPVIENITGKVIGITSHGHEDFKRESPNSSCKIPRVCLPGEKCLLSTASRVTNLEQDFKKILAAE